MINNSNINNNKLRILVVDDSRIFRGIIEKIIGERESFVVVGSARNGLKALEFLDSNDVDLVTLDVNMPDMDGFETLEVIEQINKKRGTNERIGVIMVSESTHKGADTTIMALEKGAFDFITKPKSSSGLEENFTTLSKEIVSKINNFLKTRLNGNNRLLNLDDKPCTGTNLTIEPKSPEDSDNKVDKIGFHSIKAIVIGVSTGGPKALVEILPELSDKVNVPIFIVQHMPPTFTKSLANSLDSKCRHKVIESCDNETVESDHIYIAPGGMHMILDRDNNKIVTRFSDIAPENGCKPSVDVLFRSVSTLYGGNVVAVILTGMGNDGTEGLRYLKQAGAYSIAQDESTSVVWGMPGSAVNAGLIDEVQPLQDIPYAVSMVLYRKKL